ncbi:MAG: hypothetical protein LBI49_23155, partial [Nocardiopsaceae bacterium]|nr:hypothetical protein [Nocardiopsaceae bacterium]
SKLVLVSAPAGFGKTTLLTEWLAARPAGPAGAGGDRLAAWLSLDRGDNDPAAFWGYVIAAVRTVAPSAGENALALLAAPQPPPIETVLTTLLNDLAPVAGEIVLVLDDYHVIDAREVAPAPAQPRRRPGPSIRGARYPSRAAARRHALPVTTR